MRIENNLEKYIPLGVGLALILAMVIFFIIPSQTANSLASFLSGISTLGILILTTFYVIYTNKQILELQKQRLLQIQPLPNIEIKEAKIKSPRLTIDPFKRGEIGIRVDFSIDMLIKNVGNGAAVLVDTFCYFVGNEIKTKESRIIANRFCVVEQGQELKYEKSIIDENYEALKALNKGVEGACPALKTLYDVLIRYNIIYRNLLGSAFLLKTDYVVMIHDYDDAKTLSNWLAQISSFENNFSKDIAKYNAVYQRNREEAYELFNKIKDKFLADCPNSTVDIDIMALSETFEVKHIEENKLKEISEKIYFGIPVGKIQGKSPSPDRS